MQYLNIAGNRACNTMENGGAAMVNRLTHKSYTINMAGSSYQMKEAQQWPIFEYSQYSRGTSK